MTLSGFFLRFGLFYILLNGFAIFISRYALTIYPNIGTYLVVAMAVLFACRAFRKRNARTFTIPERRRAILGMIGVDVAFQMALGLLFILEAARADDPSARGMWVLGLLITLLTCLMHALVIWVTTRLYDRHAARQIARTAATKA